VPTEVGQIITFTSADGSWSRSLKVASIDGDKITYDVVEN